MAVEESQNDPSDITPTPMFKRTAVAPVRVQWMCGVNECKGEMIFTGVHTFLFPPQFLHKCNACERGDVSPLVYPTIEYV